MQQQRAREQGPIQQQRACEQARARMTRSRETRAEVMGAVAVGLRFLSGSVRKIKCSNEKSHTITFIEIYKAKEFGTDT